MNELFSFLFFSFSQRRTLRFILFGIPSLLLHWRIADDAAVGKTFMDHEKSCLSLIHSRFLRSEQCNGHKRREEKETHFGFPLFECAFVDVDVAFLFSKHNTKKWIFSGPENIGICFFQQLRMKNRKYDAIYVCRSCGFSFLDLVSDLWRLRRFFFGFSSLALEVVRLNGRPPISK